MVTIAGARGHEPWTIPTTCSRCRLSCARVEERPKRAALPCFLARCMVKFYSTCGSDLDLPVQKLTQLGHFGLDQFPHVESNFTMHRARTHGFCEIQDVLATTLCTISSQAHSDRASAIYCLDEIVSLDQVDEVMLHSKLLYQSPRIRTGLLLGKTPFYRDNPRELGRQIITDPVTIPNDFERDYPGRMLKDLIGRLLVKTPEERIRTMEKIKCHDFFARRLPDEAAWERLLRNQRQSPFAPKLSGPFDTTFSQRIDEEDEDLKPYYNDGSNV